MFYINSNSDCKTVNWLVRTTLVTNVKERSKANTQLTNNQINKPSGPVGSSCSSNCCIVDNRACFSFSLRSSWLWYSTQNHHDPEHWEPSSTSSSCCVLQTDGVPAQNLSYIKLKLRRDEKKTWNQRMLKNGWSVNNWEIWELETLNDYQMITVVFYLIMQDLFSPCEFISSPVRWCSHCLSL